MSTRGVAKKETERIVFRPFAVKPKGCLGMELDVEFEERVTNTPVVQWATCQCDITFFIISDTIVNIIYIF